jgi:hypothetical protein
MLQSITKYNLFIIISLFLSACSSSHRPIQESEDKLPKMKEATLIHRLDSLSKLRPDYFYSKISSKYSDSELNVSFKTSVRMRADSALNAIITFARIPIYNSMVTPDTLTIVDKRNNCYVKETMGYLKETFSVDFEHHNIEEILLGLPTGWDLDEDYYQIKDPYNYVISSHNKRKLKRSDKDLTGDVYIRYFLSDDATNLKRIIIDSPMDTTSIDINYYKREEINQFNVPLEADVRVYTPRDTIYIDLNYSKTTVNEPRVLYLSIPDKYERCE